MWRQQRNGMSDSVGGPPDRDRACMSARQLPPGVRRKVQSQWHRHL